MEVSAWPGLLCDGCIGTYDDDTFANETITVARSPGGQKAMFSLGTTELVILFIVGFLCLAVPAGLALLIIFIVRRQPSEIPGDHAALMAENQRLREEIARLKHASGQQ